MVVESIDPSKASPANAPAQQPHMQQAGAARKVGTTRPHERVAPSAVRLPTVFEETQLQHEGDMRIL